MTEPVPTDSAKIEEMDSASRRDFMKIAGIGALGLAYINPVIETLHGGDPLGNYDPTGGGGSSSSNHQIPSSSNPQNPSSSYPDPSSSSLPQG